MAQFFTLLLMAVLSLTACTKKNTTPESSIVGYLEANIPHLDPIHSTNKYSSVVNSNIFEGLYHYHYLKRPISLEPSLADGMPKVSKDGLTYTIQIKKGVFFQDDLAFQNGKGREVTAQDFIYSWKRLADPKNKALGWWVFDSLIEGLNEWRDQMRSGKASYDSPVSGLQAINAHTLQIKLTRPSFQFLHFLAMPVTTVVAKEVVSKYKKEIINHPVGTGPFQLKRWVRNSEVQLIKNKNYRKDFYPASGTSESKNQGFLKDSGKKLPLSNQVTIKIINEMQPQWLSFLKGEIDHGTIPKDNYDQVEINGQLTEEYSNKGLQILVQHRPDVIYITLNMEHPIIGKNKYLRKALAAAVDKKTILEKFYNNRGIIAESPIPPGLDSYDSSYKHPISFNRAKAKEYLKLAGYPEGKGLPVFNYEMPSSAMQSRQFGEFIKDQFDQIGVKIKLNANTWPQFDKKIKTKQASMFDMAWSADYPDSENFLQLFYSKNISPGPNNFNFMNREYDSIYQKAISLPIGKERTLLFRKLVNIINEEVPCIFTVHRSFRTPYHSWLKNFNRHPIIYDHYKYIRVDSKQKEQSLKKL